MAFTLSVVANTVLGCLHPVKRAYFASVPEEHAASISRASICKVEEANRPLRCQQHNPLPCGIRRERERHTHTHTGGFVTCTLARYGRHTHSPAHTHSWVWDMHNCQIWQRHTHSWVWDMHTCQIWQTHTHTHSWVWDMHTCQIWHSSQMHNDPLWLFIKTGFTVTDTNPKS
jgi:hypothetical protein